MRPNYIATATVETNHADGWRSSMQLPYVEFIASDRSDAIRYAHEYYGRLAADTTLDSDVLVAIHVSVEGL